VCLLVKLGKLSEQNSRMKTAEGRRRSSQDTKPSYFLICFLFILLIFFLQPKLVGSLICTGHGSIDPTTGLCNCITNWHGGDCSLRYCPVGPSWAEPSQEDHQRYRPRVECSNMGICDDFTGKCNCRSGYEGRACERSQST
jgi:hypothetical protein